MQWRDSVARRRRNLHPVRLLETLVEWRLRSYCVTVLGIEHLHAPEETAVIIAANHVQPENAFLEASGFGPDSFVLQSVAKSVGRRTRIVAKYDLDEWQRKHIPGFLRPMAEAIQEKLVVMHGDIPVRRNSVRNRRFLQEMRRAVSERDVILMYPTGEWAADFGPDHEVQPGVAHVAKRFRVPVVPAYIRGCTSWRARQKVDVVFGEPICCLELSRQELRARIQHGILDCRQRLTVCDSTSESEASLMRLRGSEI